MYSVKNSDCDSHKSHFLFKIYNNVFSDFILVIFIVYWIPHKSNYFQLFMSIYHLCIYFWNLYHIQGSSWLWSYGRWFYDYLCNQCLSPLELWVWILHMVRCTRYNIMRWSLSVICHRLVVFSKNSVSSTNKTGRHNITSKYCGKWR